MAVEIQSDSWASWQSLITCPGSWVQYPLHCGISLSSSVERQSAHVVLKVIKVTGLRTINKVLLMTGEVGPKGLYFSLVQIIAESKNLLSLWIARSIGDPRLCVRGVLEGRGWSFEPHDRCGVTPGDCRSRPRRRVELLRPRAVPCMVARLGWSA